MRCPFGKIIQCGQIPKLFQCGQIRKFIFFPKGRRIYAGKIP